jgi:hypothetical protein
MTALSYAVKASILPAGAGARYAVLVTKRSDLVRRGGGGCFLGVGCELVLGSWKSYQETRKEGGGCFDRE